MPDQGPGKPGSRNCISAVVRCHNHGQYLEEAVRSLVCQVRPPDEIVVVDDGSTDETADIARDLVRRGWVSAVVTNQPAKGPAISFNHAVMTARGDFIIALDADDRLSSRYLDLAERELATSGADLAYGGEHRFGAQHQETPPPAWDPGGFMVENAVHVSVLFRRWIFDATHGFNPRFDDLGLEDWEYWVHAIELGAVGVPVDGCWLEYRRHPAGSRNALRHVDALRAHLLVHRLHPTTLRWRHLLRWAARSVARNARRFVGS